METISIDEITPASYNPRKIDSESFESLCNSINTLGVLKPILIRKENNTIIAGHQRTKAMKHNGIKETLCYKISDITDDDEIRFNQIHNKCDVEISDNQPIVKIPTTINKDRVVRVKAKDIIVEKNCGSAYYKHIICTMLMKYGEFCAPVATTDGEVICSSLYASCAKMLNIDTDFIIVDKSMKDVVVRFFSREYGTFSYDHLKKNTYIQGYAQMFRLREAVTGRRYQHAIQ